MLPHQALRRSRLPPSAELQLWLQPRRRKLCGSPARGTCAAPGLRSASGRQAGGDRVHASAALGVGTFAYSTCSCVLPLPPPTPPPASAEVRNLHLTLPALPSPGLTCAAACCLRLRCLCTPMSQCSCAMRECRCALQWEVKRDTPWDWPMAAASPAWMPTMPPPAAGNSATGAESVAATEVGEVGSAAVGSTEIEATMLMSAADGGGAPGWG